MAFQHSRGRLLALLVPALLAAVFMLAGCGVSGLGGAAPTATPSAAQIIQNAQNFKITDAIFTMTLNGSFGGQSASGTADGKLTKSPARYDITFNLTASGEQIAFETVSDGTSNSIYTKFTQPSLLATGKWTKSSGGSGAGVFDPSQLTDYSQIKNVTLVGKDTVNGVAVWHLKGQTTDSGETAAIDVYVRQDNYAPVQFKVQGSGSSSLSAVITFTAVNSGISIALPPADQVQSGQA